MSSRTLALLLLCLVFSGSESRPRPMYEVGCSKTRYVVLIHNRSLFKYFDIVYNCVFNITKRGWIFRSCMMYSMVHNSYTLSCTSVRINHLAVLILYSCMHGIHYLYIEHGCNVICSTEVISLGS